MQRNQLGLLIFVLIPVTTPDVTSIGKSTATSTPINIL
jgi:hypothetical protein